MISSRLLIYSAIFIGGALALWWYGESREEDGYNKAVAEQSEAIAEWERLKREEYAKALEHERTKAQTLLNDLSTLRGDYAALQREVSHVQVVKPLREDRAICADYNPLGPDFGRLWNLGASGAIGAAKAAAGSGDEPVPRVTE